MNRQHNNILRLEAQSSSSLCANYLVCCFFQTLIKEMSHHINILDTYDNMDDSGNVVVPLEKFDAIKRRYIMT